MLVVKGDFMKALTSQDWYLILTAVSKLAPFGPIMLADKQRVAGIVQRVYTEMTTKGAK